MIALIVVIMVAILVWYVINAYAPPPFKIPLIVLDILLLCLWLLQWGGVWHFPGR